MAKTDIHEICKTTGKWMLTEREAGNTIRIAGRLDCGKNIPKSIYICPFCSAYHSLKKLPVYHRSTEPDLRIYDYM